MRVRVGFASVVMLAGCAYPREPSDRATTIPVYLSAGARVGADAVLVAPARNLGSGVIGIQTDTMPSTIMVDFVGDALRFLPGTCRGSG